MAHAYSPGLQVSRRTRRSWRRVLPIAGDVLVQAGDRVAARDVVARSCMPGDVTPVNLANLLALPPADVPECLLKAEGDRIERDEPLARTKGIFGLFKSEYRSRLAGTIESISRVTGQVIVRGEPLPVQVTAYVAGEVVEVLEGEGVVVEAVATFVQGIFGIGGETCGPVRLVCERPDEELSAEQIGDDLRGAVVIGGSRVSGEAVSRAIDVGAAAIVCGGIDDADLIQILGYDLGVAITGSEEVGISLVVTEGFGAIAMAERTFEFLRSREGAVASVNGATQIRAGVMRPEVVIPHDETDTLDEVDRGASDGWLDIGTPVRIIRDPYFGLIGVVADLPPELRKLESESKARILEVVTASGERLTVPRANVEIIAG